MKSDSKKYILYRDNRPISYEEFSQEDAEKELERWRKILERWPDGTKVRMEEVKEKENI